MARKYVLRARAEAADDTRRRILEATRRSVEKLPLTAVTLDEVARVANVARSTIYTAFGSRTGLFEALARYLLERVGFDRLVAAVRHPDAREALLGSLRESARVYAAERDVARALFSWGDVDPDAAGAVRVLETGRAPGMMDLARRLADQGVLRDDLTVNEAADLLWVITSFDTFDQLYTGRRLSSDAVAKRVMSLAERALLKG
jgi:AcrR family transcriptional regulator